MRKIDFKTYKLLFENQFVLRSFIAKSVLESDTFQNLICAGILESRKVGRGFKIIVSKELEFEKFFKKTFPNQHASKSKSGNIKKYRNSKATKVDSRPIFLFRGFRIFEINNQLVNVKAHTIDFGLFAATPNAVFANKICFVENLETFLNAEKLLGTDYLFIHKYGRIGKDSISALQAKEVLVFVDYDFNGLDEYLRIKEVFQNATLYMPSNYNKLFDKYAKVLKKNKAKMSNSVKNSQDTQVIKIREQVARSNEFLEQEFLIDV